MSSNKTSWNRNSVLKNNSLLESYIYGISKRDKESFVNLYNATSSAIYGYILSIIKNPDTSKDLLQEVYIKIYEKAHLYESKGKVLAWIFTLSKNLCLMHIRKDKETVDIDKVLDYIGNDKFSANLIDKLVLEASFTKISDVERQIIFLHVLSGLKHKEIAKLLDIPLSTVLSKYNRALKKLKKILKEDIYEV